MPIAGGRLKVYMRGCAFADMTTLPAAKKYEHKKTYAPKPVHLYTFLLKTKRTRRSPTSRDVSDLLDHAGRI